MSALFGQTEPNLTSDEMILLAQLDPKYKLASVAEREAIEKYYQRAHRRDIADGFEGLDGLADGVNGNQ